ncbi:MAG: protein tyrosine phosphatase [Eubacteriales bacterium]|nr:protein tyrosine phosphatase [Eubacteriales bacterium]
MKQEYIDIHCHMLPEVDDGAENMETALSMLALSEKQGAREIILTPHYEHGCNGYRKGELSERFSELCERAEAAGIGLKLHLGNEILWFDGAVQAVRDKEALTLAGSRYMLIEFYPDVSFQQMLRAVRSVVQEGYIPVIAHYERYETLRRQNGDQEIEELLCQGALFQMNFNSLSGKGLLSGICPDRRTAWCRRQVKAGNVSFFGTDAHNLGARSPEHDRAAAWLKAQIGEAELLELLFENPQDLIADRTI